MNHHNKKLTNYVSNLDRFLTEFDKSHELTAAQRKERDKALRISRLRDTSSSQVPPKNKIWDEF